MTALRLNKAQRQAVEHDHGPLLVLAGAGSGKTGVVTKRIARLIESGVPARNILAVTFTNKAAAEMSERVIRLVGAKPAKQLLACTFHRFGLHILSKEARALGLRGGRFAIYDRGDCMSVLRESMRSLRTAQQVDLSAVLNRISLAKNAMLDPESYAAQKADSDDEYDQLTIEAYGRYQSGLRALQAYDFDDLIVEPVRLLCNQPEVRNRWQARFRYVIVDEYQDTNVVQLELLRQLVDSRKNLCVVGDDAQAIYAWRGADVRNILDFPLHFRGAKVVKLERNYRSTANILNVANAVLEASEGRRHEKRLICTQGEGKKVELVRAEDNESEAQFVAQQIQRLIDSGEARPRDIAILYRSNKQAPEMEAALKMQSVVYELCGSKQMFEKKEVKDLLAYLRAAVEPYDEIAVRRTLNYPARGIGEVALGHIIQWATAKDRSLFETLRRSHEIPNLSAAAREGCRDYVRIVTAIQNGIEQERPCTELLDELIEKISLKKAIAAECGSNNKAAARRWSNVKYLRQTFLWHDERPDPNMRDLLKKLVLRDDDGDETEKEKDRVTMVTMHGSKGLEFPYVFLIGLEEGLMPHKRVLDERITDTSPLAGGASDEVEQERRLLYVAITRAKKHLCISHCRTRTGRGAVQKRALSRFLQTLDEELFDARDLQIQTPLAASETKLGADQVLAALLGN